MTPAKRTLSLRQTLSLLAMDVDDVSRLHDLLAFLSAAERLFEIEVVSCSTPYLSRTRFETADLSLALQSLQRAMHGIKTTDGVEE